MLQTRHAAAVLFAAMLAPSAFSQAADQINVTTVDQRVVAVFAQEIFRAYQVLTKNKSTNYKTLYTNDDGSATIVEPRFKYRGANVPFFGAKEIRNDVALKHLSGVCRLYGFQNYVTYTPSVSTAERAYMNENGTLGSVSAGSSYQNESLADITCR